MDQLPFELNDEFLRELGRITARFADLEFFVGRMIAFMLGKDINKGDLLMANLSFRQRLDILGGLTHYSTTDEKVLVAVDAAIKKASVITEERNRCVHSQWHLETGSREAKRSKPKVSRKKGYEHHFEPVAVSELQKVSGAIMGVMQDFAILWQLMAVKELLPAVSVIGYESNNEANDKEV